MSEEPELVAEWIGGRDAEAIRFNLAEFVAGKAARYAAILKSGGKLVGHCQSTNTSFDFGSDEVFGVGLLLDTASKLMDGGNLLFRHGNSYGASALVRQLVEVEYLMWTFAVGDGAAKIWLEADKAQRMKLFAPAKMRKESKGKFRNCYYSYHCEMGGHPSPRGGALLDGGRGINQLMLYDMLAHSQGIFFEFGNWANKNNFSGLIGNSDYQEVIKRFNDWQIDDQLSKLSPPPEDLEGHRK